MCYIIQNFRLYEVSINTILMAIWHLRTPRFMNIKSVALNQSASKDRDSHINLLYVNLSLLLSHLHIKK